MARPSPVRDSVREAFGADSRHAWSLEELLELVRQTTGRGDYSTVFRAVSMLEAEGAVRRIDVGDGRARYEPVGEHHEHVQCDHCGRVEEVPECLAAGWAERVRASTGFEVLGHRLTFSGLCPDCAAAG
ncbi:MAG: transcriptional repressor [Candidatus Dormibacteraeota bacterium]|nr:transcriptional repressor [Candidatus Dormibacteraeota bacterium]